MHRLQNADLGLLFVRVAVGIVFMNAGWMKLTSMAMVVTGLGPDSRFLLFSIF